jgi:hypothetical protein
MDLPAGADRPADRSSRSIDRSGVRIPHRRSNTGTPFSFLEAFVESGR